ncbi:MAG: methyltransferase domain-containing protein [Chloroflexi bacterium]|nr:methyltransferase domain-containing protein [Chloroflexota bacterium]
MKLSPDVGQVDNLSYRKRKAHKIVAVLRDFLGDDLTNLACLDLGCREGIVAEALSAQFRFAVGVDIEYLTSSDADERGRTQNSHEALLSFVQANGKELPFPDEYFDVIVCAQVYEHVDDPAKLVREIRRVSKPGGAVFFSGPNRLALIEEHYHLPLLSWLPQKWATAFMRLARRGRAYNIRPLSYWGLRKLLSGFEIHDYAPTLLRNPGRFSVEERVRVEIPRWMGHIVKPFAPNFNWVLSAVCHLPSSAYTQDYLLTECDGHSEFLASLGEFLPQRLARALEIADIQAGQRALDIGCGRGELVLHCAKLGAQAWGADNSPEALKIVRQLSPIGQMAFQQAEAGDLPFATRCFDIVFMLDLVEHLTPAQLERSLREARRVLKPGGKLVLHTMPNLWYYRYGYPLYRLTQNLRGQRLPKDPRSRWRFAHLHVNEQTPLELRKALLGANFQAKIWLESTQKYSYESNPILRAVMQTLVRIPPFEWIFCNDIFATCRTG